MENNKKPTLEQVLGKQALKILHDAEITDLCIEDDGSISGSRLVMGGLPTRVSIKNIELRICKDKIIIDGQVTDRHIDEGKII